MRVTPLGLASLLSLAAACSQPPETPARTSMRLAAVTSLRTYATGVVSQLACALCPADMGAKQSTDGWELAGRPDPVQIAEALGAPELAASIADRITDAEMALSETPNGDEARASDIVASLAHDLDQLAEGL